MLMLRDKIHFDEDLYDTGVRHFIDSIRGNYIDGAVVPFWYGHEISLSTPYDMYLQTINIIFNDITNTLLQNIYELTLKEVTNAYPRVSVMPRDIRKDVDLKGFLYASRVCDIQTKQNAKSEMKKFTEDR